MLRRSSVILRIYPTSRDARMHLLPVRLIEREHRWSLLRGWRQVSRVETSGQAVWSASHWWTVHMDDGRRYRPTWRERRELDDAAVTVLAIRGPGRRRRA